MLTPHCALHSLSNEFALFSSPENGPSDCSADCSAATPVVALAAEPCMFLFFERARLSRSCIFGSERFRITVGKESPEVQLLNSAAGAAVTSTFVTTDGTDRGLRWW